LRKARRASRSLNRGRFKGRRFGFVLRR
jgi:hypothetical protein